MLFNFRTFGRDANNVYFGWTSAPLHLTLPWPTHTHRSTISIWSKRAQDLLSPKLFFCQEISREKEHPSERDLPKSRISFWNPKKTSKEQLKLVRIFLVPQVEVARRRNRQDHTLAPDFRATQKMCCDLWQFSRMQPAAKMTSPLDCSLILTTWFTVSHLNAGLSGLKSFPSLQTIHHSL